MALLQGGTFYCGGAIISRHHVLTSALCARLRLIDSVYAGSAVLSQNGSLHQVEKTVVHEDWKTPVHPGYIANDIALLRVTEPFQIDETRQLIQLFEAGEQVWAGVEAVSTGWGSTNGSRNAIAKQLQAITVPVVNRTACDEAYKKTIWGGLIDGQMCAGGDGKGACYHDIGGPLDIDGRLVGIVSLHLNCGLLDYPAVYTDVTYFRKWIDEHMDL